MEGKETLTTRFEDHRAHLRAVAFRMLGSMHEAEDAVQEAWLRLDRADTSDVENLGGWLTTVVSRICLDTLRSRKSRAEDPLEDELFESRSATSDPESDVLIEDAVGDAMLVMLDTLSPAERVSLVLHDMFDLSFDEIAAVLGRSAEATRQLASRARRRVRFASRSASPDRERKLSVVRAFLDAARGGDLRPLIALLDPNVVLRADAFTVKMGAEPEINGVVAVAETFKGRAQAAEVALVDGVPALVWAVRGTPRVVFDIMFSADAIASITLIADPERIAGMKIEFV